MTKNRLYFSKINNPNEWSDEWPEAEIKCSSPELAKEIEKRWNTYERLLNENENMREALERILNVSTDAAAMYHANKALDKCKGE